MTDSSKVGRRGAVALDKQQRLDALLADAAALLVKARVRLLDRIQHDLVVERDDGIRMSAQSVAEYRRARKATAADAALLDWIRSFGPGDVFFDVGANTGLLSLLAARMHEGRVPVYAVEPAADTFAALVRNVVLNGLGSAVTPLHVALFDTNAVQPLFRSALGAGSALHAMGDPLDFARRPFTPALVEPVLACRLDDLLRWYGLPRPTRLKIDVDGAEAKVLAGALETLTGPCELYLELVEAAPGDAYPAHVIATLEQLGYHRARTIEHRVAGEYPRVFDTLFVRPAA
jgi:FkbM family methyltransferase